jgi:hypothetical protein
VALDQPWHAVLLKELEQKLNGSLADRWARIKVKKKGIVDLLDFQEYIEEIFKAASYSCIFKHDVGTAASRSNERKSTTIFHASEGGEQMDPLPPLCYFVKRDWHRFYFSSGFQKEEHNLKWEMVKEYDVCFRCLKNGHRTLKCPQQKACGVDGCDACHHQTLHLSKKSAESHYRPMEQDKVSAENNNFASGEMPTAIIRVIPVWLKGPKAEEGDYALLDEGSTVKIMNRNFVEQLGLNGVLRVSFRAVV